MYKEVKMKKKTSIGRDVEKLEHSYTAGENEKLYNHFGKRFDSFLKS